MDPRSLPRQFAHVGLCAVCSYGRHLEARKGTEYWSCERSRSDRRFRQYPGLPVLRCPGFEERDSSSLP